MKLLDFRRRRFACRMALVVVFSLLFQQAAIAAYTCRVDHVPAKVMAEMPNCESMTEAEPRALCEKHCNPDNSTTPDVRVIGAPASTLPPVKFDLARHLPARHGPKTYENVPVARSDPPPVVRFCSLLI